MTTHSKIILQSLLFRAIEDFKERIAPVFCKVETQKQEINSLRDDLRRTRRERDKLRKLELLQTEITTLKTALSETERNTDEALRLAEAAKDELAAQHASTNQWKKKAAQLEQENKRCKDLLDRHVNSVSLFGNPSEASHIYGIKCQARLQKEKYKKLTKEITTLKSQKLAQEERELMTATSNVCPLPKGVLNYSEQ